MSSKIPAWLGVPTLMLAIVVSAPATLTSYDAYFYGDYRDVYLYFLDRPGTRIYSLGLRPFFLLGRHTQHRVIYDLNPPRRWRDDPTGFVQEVVRCVAPSFLVLAVDAPADVERLRHDGLALAAQGSGYVILENQHERGDSGCRARYDMHP